MPTWLQIILWVAGGLTAISIIWKKFVTPVARLITLAERILPLLTRLADVFKDDPNVFHVLNEIAAQFRTDSGSSLRDVVNRLEVAAQEQRRGAELQKELAQIDRETVERAVLSIDRIAVKVEKGAATGIRIEKQQASVADDLAAAHRHEPDDSKPGGDASSGQ